MCSPLSVRYGAMEITPVIMIITFLGQFSCIPFKCGNRWISLIAVYSCSVVNLVTGENSSLAIQADNSGVNLPVI